MRCEDYPCCGCGPEGCIDFSRTVKCKDCRQSYHPDSMTQEYCYRCQAADRIRLEDEHGDPYDWRDE